MMGQKLVTERIIAIFPFYKVTAINTQLAPCLWQQSTSRLRIPGKVQVTSLGVSSGTSNSTTFPHPINNSM
jgi:hypothetical protein